jgi:hypothetical protein
LAVLLFPFPKAVSLELGTKAFSRKKKWSFLEDVSRGHKKTRRSKESHEPDFTNKDFSAEFSVAYETCSCGT